MGWLAWEGSNSGWVHSWLEEVMVWELWRQGSRPVTCTPFLTSVAHQQGAVHCTPQQGIAESTPQKCALQCSPPALCTHCAICPRPPAVYPLLLEQPWHQLEPVGK